MSHLSLITVQTPGASLRYGVDSVSTYFGNIWRGPVDQAKLAQLSAIAMIASTYTEVLDRQAAEIDSLKAALNLENYGRIKIPAYVHSYYPLENRLTLGAGKNQLVRKGSAVVAPEGLVGVVQTVDDDTSQVQLLSSPLPFKVGALVEAGASPAGLMHGEGPNRLILELVDPNAQVKPGDRVITSGYSERIPRGIPIGRVLEVRDEKEFGRISVQVFPYAKIGDLRVVSVLR